MPTHVGRALFNTPGVAHLVPQKGDCDLVPERRRVDPVGALVVLIGIAGIVVATLHPSGHTTDQSWNLNLWSGEAALAELLQNLILFVPLGIGLALLGVPILPAMTFGALLSFSVEFTQQWIPGRDPSVGDILCNTISTAIGVALVKLAPRWLTISPGRSAWHALGAATVAILVWLGSAALLRPTFGPSPYKVVPRPDFDFWGRYRGEVLDTRMQGGMLYVKATFPRRPPGRPSPLAAVLDGRDKLATVVSVTGRDLSMRYDMPSLRLTLEQPDLRWENALAKVAPADTFETTIGHESGRLCMAVGMEWRCDFGYTIGDGWKLIFNPEHWPGWLLTLIDACWVAGWTVGVGFWAGRTGGERNGGERNGGEGRRRAAKAAVALVLLAMIVVPMTTHFKGSSLAEWVGALLGIEAGLLFGN